MRKGSPAVGPSSLNLFKNPFLKFFLLSKQFQAEAEPVAYRQNTFTFTNTVDISCFPRLAANLYSLATIRIRKYIKNVELTLDGSTSSLITNRIMVLMSPPEYKFRKIIIGRKEKKRMKRNFEALPSLEKLTVHAKIWPAEQSFVSILGGILSVHGAFANSVRSSTCPSRSAMVRRTYSRESFLMVLTSRL
jgi:hypothetical protein